MKNLKFRGKRKRRLFWVVFPVCLFFALYFLGSLLFDQLDKSIQHYEHKIGRILNDNGVVACWDFDDVEIHELVTAKVCFTKGTTLVKGHHGSARKFLPERNGYVRTPSSLALLSGNYTFTCWLSIPDPTRNQRIFRYMNVVDGWLTYYVFGSEKPLHAKLSETNGFVFVAVAVDGNAGQARLYIDGELKSSINIRKVVVKHDIVDFGQVKGCDRPEFMLDDVVFWRRCLSESEIDTFFFSKNSIKKHIASSYCMKLHVLKVVRGIFDNIISSIDWFNPLIHESKAMSSDISRYDLILSKRDLKVFREFGNYHVRNGINEYDTSERRAIGLLLNGSHIPARMEMVCNGDPGAYARKSFAIERNDFETSGKLVRFLFEPPEWHDFLPLLLIKKLSLALGTRCVSSELCAVTVNGVFDGVYFVNEVGAEVGRYSLVASGQWRDSLRSLPFSRDEVLKEYDLISAKLLPVLLADRRNPMNSIELRDMLEAQRDETKKALDRSESEHERTLIEMVREYMTEDVLLGGNPVVCYIVEDLDLSCREVRGVSIAYKSMTPDVLSDEGVVMRRLEESSEASLQLIMRYGSETVKKILVFTVIPADSKMPLLMLNIARKVTPDIRVISSVQLIEDAGRSKSDWIPSRIKLRGNSSLVHAKKHYFSIKMDAPHDFLDLGGSRYLLLTSCYRDPTFMHDKLSYDLFRSFSAQGKQRYSPRFYYVNLVINNEYHGIYGLSDKIDSSMLKFNMDVPPSCRPVLYKALGAHANFRGIHRHSYLQKEPHWKSGKYWGPYDQLITFIATADKREFAAGIEKILDVDNVIDFQILLNFTNNRDGVRHNLFLARDGGAGARFFIVPWDYDNAYLGSTWLSNHLFSRLKADLPGYIMRLKVRWDELRKRELSEVSIMERMDDMEDTLSDDVVRNFERWPMRDGGSFEGDVLDMRIWIKKRLIQMDKKIENMLVSVLKE